MVIIVVKFVSFSFRMNVSFELFFSLFNSNAKHIEQFTKKIIYFL